MGRQSLPVDAFEYYVALGPKRSYQAVADHFGTSKRSVARRAASENWQTRLRELEVKARAQCEHRIVDDLAEQQA
ncbi:MAG: hypothetical protein D6744_17815, partial [Planctomycetota bacterium]